MDKTIEILINFPYVEVVNSQSLLALSQIAKFVIGAGIINQRI